MGSRPRPVEADRNHSSSRRRCSLLVHGFYRTYTQRQLGVWSAPWEEVQRSSGPRNVGRRVPIGCGWRCHVKAIRRAPSLDFPHAPTHPCAFPARAQPRAREQPRGSEEMHASPDCTFCRNHVNGLCFGQPASSPLVPIQSPSTAGIDRNGHHLHYLFL